MNHCRCGISVSRCVMGCTLFVCCGGYVSEGHMSDCADHEPAREHGENSDLGFTGADVSVYRHQTLALVDSAIAKLTAFRSRLREARAEGHDAYTSPTAALRDLRSAGEATRPMLTSFMETVHYATAKTHPTTGAVYAATSALIDEIDRIPHI